MKEKLISMSEAAKLSPYEQEYLSLLARRGELKAEKVGRNWFTTVDWLNEYIATKKPSEVISDEKPAKKFRFGLSEKMIWISFFAISLMVLSGALIFHMMFKKVSDIESKTKNQFVPEEITKVPNDKGNYDIYGSGRMKMGEEKIPAL